MKKLKPYLVSFFLFLCLQSYSQKKAESAKPLTVDPKIEQTVKELLGSKISIVKSAKGSTYTYTWGGNTIIKEYFIDTSFTFNGEDRIVRLDFIISEDSNELSFYATGSIKGGSLKLLLIDPKGRKHPGFTLKAKGDGSAKGVVTEVNDDILKGKWAIEVNNNNSTGRVNLKLGQN